MLQIIIEEPKLSSIKRDLLPKLVNEQWSLAAQPTMRQSRQSEISELGIADEARVFLSQVSPEWGAAHEEVRDKRFCGVFLVGDHHFCLRVKNVMSLLDCNREVASFEPGTFLAVFFVF